jgi:NADPH:quinone reductase-like Zn-dependent oxidoreductase
MRMKAAICDRYGPPEVVRIADVAKPAPRPNEVLVRVRATTVNRTDCGVRKASPFFIRLFYGIRRPRATILGNEFAGEIEGVGDDVTLFTIGDRVFGFNPGFTGRHGEFGAHAEYLVMPADSSIAAMPPELTFEQAAPSTEGAHYALALVTKAGIQREQDVLVYGATGAIGSAAVQLAKDLGARVTAVCATPHLDLVRGLGADKVVDYTAGDFTQDDQQYDAVLDAVGKSSFGRCKRLLKQRGRYLSTDPRPLLPYLVRMLVTPLLGGRQVIFPFPTRSRATMAHIKGLIESRAFNAVVDRWYPLDQIVDAYRYVETGQKIGGVVITT